MTLPSPGAVTDADTQRALDRIREEFPLEDLNLASPNNAVYRTVFRSGATIGDDVLAATYLLGRNATGAIITSGTTTTTTGGEWVDLPLLPIVAADYTVDGKTTKLRVRAQVAANATQPTITFTFGLYPISVAGAADNLTFTAGTVVAGSTVAIASPAASTVTAGASAEFDVPTDGAYALGVVTSGTLTNDNTSYLSALLQMRHT